jgi:hypothetical protein
MSASILEYSYESELGHLDDVEALETYKRERILRPDAMIVLDDRPCGHWDVEVYESKEEKREYLQKRISQIFDRFFNTFKKR